MSSDYVPDRTPRGSDVLRGIVIGVLLGCAFWLILLAMTQEAAH